MTRAATTLAHGLALAVVALLGTPVAHADGFRGDHDPVALENDLESAGYGGVRTAHDIDVEEHMANETCAARADGVTNQRLIDDVVQVTQESRLEAEYTIFAEEFHFCPGMLGSREDALPA
jgi:hypothetical protein